MLTFEARIADSTIPNAGLGLFTLEALSKSRTLIVPNEQQRIYTLDELNRFEPESIEQASAICWFEETYSVDPEWSYESHLNHSFTPNAHWHLGFVFALEDIDAGSEITIDYSYLLDQSTTLEFRDSLSGREISGLCFKERMHRSCLLLAELFQETQKGGRLASG